MPSVVRRTALAILAAAALITGACMPVLTRERQRPGFGMPHDPVAGESMPVGGTMEPRADDGAERKRVVSKEDPSTLVAFDRSRCIVTEERYRNTRVGSRAVCAWRSPDRAQ